MDDQEFALELRRALLLMAHGASDPAIRRGMLQIVSAIEKRYDIPELRVVKQKKLAG